MSASLTGCLRQTRFPCFIWVIVTHPGHASLRSLVDTVMSTVDLAYEFCVNWKIMCVEFTKSKFPRQFGQLPHAHRPTAGRRGPAKDA